MDPVYQFDLKVPAEVVDGNGHVNNVAYVQWMQDAAISQARTPRQFSCVASSKATM